MTGRYLDVDVFASTMPRQRVPADDTVGGFPTTGARLLGGIGATQIGIQEMTPGMVRDEECDEVFVVLTGRGSVEFQDGEVIPLTPGAVVRLHKGDRTIWHVAETLRKVYITG
ncbi:MAG: cupin domain-containing protein [Nocardioides sp.]|uniref:cupin domain-containing protein n=1 Tax=Nocardioides sp. TaxID=35761 RepID=UPI0039E570D0